jgi:hypothetical protein
VRQVYGDFDNLLEPTSAVFNMGLRRLNDALQHFGAMPADHTTLLQMYADATAGAGAGTGSGAGAAASDGTSASR